MSLLAGMNICAFMGSQAPNPLHEKEVLLLAKKAARLGCNFITGGQSDGLMGGFISTAEKYKQNGAEIIGITTDQIRAIPNIAPMHPGNTKVLCPADEAGRHKLYHEYADAYVVCPGGFGSFIEHTASQFENYYQMYAHLNAQKPFTPKPLVLFNINGFYNGMIEQNESAIEEGYVPAAGRDLYWPTEQKPIDHRDVINYLIKSKKNPTIISPK